MTPAQERALRWIAEREPIGSFPVDGPSVAFVRRLEFLGLVERVGKERGEFGFVLWRLTDEARAALDLPPRG